MARRTDGRETFNRLLEWEKDSASAERLAAIILKEDGFSNIDPSHPLGGKDGLRDMILSFKGEKWIAGVCFPRGQQSFLNIKKKFQHDIVGTTSNNSLGFAFVTNQELRISERRELIDLYSDLDIEIYHLERIASLLNTPKYYGIRLEFLDIDMTKEEQLSFFANHEKRMISIDEKLDKLTVGLEEYKEIVSFAFEDEPIFYAPVA